MLVRPRSRLQMHSGNDLNRWTVSFADFMTLMFAVFVVLYAVAASKEEKYQAVIQSIQEASKFLKPAVFSGDQQQILTEASNTLVEQRGPALLREAADKQAEQQLSEVDNYKTGEQLQQLKNELEAMLVADLGKELIKLDLDGDWLTIELGGNLLFVGGSHTLLSSAQEQLQKLAQVLLPVNNMLRIRGYTDQEPISNEIYLSNWELAGARAFSVLHQLNMLGIPGNRMAMEAYGQFRPVVDAQGRVDKIKSRRVVIAISKYAVINPPAVSQQPSTVVAEPEKESLAVEEIKPDSEEMREIHLPNNRLIITTRQE